MEVMVDNVDTRSEIMGILPPDGAKRRSSEQPVRELTPKGRKQDVCFLAVERLDIHKATVLDGDVFMVIRAWRLRIRGRCAP